MTLWYRRHGHTWTASGIGVLLNQTMFLEIKVFFLHVMMFFMFTHFFQLLELFFIYTYTQTYRHTHTHVNSMPKLVKGKFIFCFFEIGLCISIGEIHKRNAIVRHEKCCAEGECWWNCQFNKMGMTRFYSVYLSSNNNRCS